MRRLLFGRKIVASVVTGAMLLGLMCGQMPAGVRADAASVSSLTDSHMGAAKTTDLKWLPVTKTMI